MTFLIASRPNRPVPLAAGLPVVRRHSPMRAARPYFGVVDPMRLDDALLAAVASLPSKIISERFIVVDAVPHPAKAAPT